MATRQYIGARYVIKIYENSQTAGSADWEANVNYEPLTMVTYNYGSYLSKKQVPATVGNPVDNPEYWVQTGFYNGQIAQLQEEIDAIETIVDGIKDSTFVQTDKTSAVFFGDSLTAGDMGGVMADKPYPIVYGEISGLEVTNKGVNGQSAANHGSGNYLQQQISLTDFTEFDQMFICHGCNDFSGNSELGTIEDTSITTFYGALNTAIASAYAQNPAIEIILMTTFWARSTTKEYGSTLMQTVYNNVNHTIYDYIEAVKNVASRYNLRCIDIQDAFGVNTSDYSAYLNDDVHMNQDGYTKVGKYIAKQMSFPKATSAVDIRQIAKQKGSANLINVGDFETTAVSGYDDINKKCGDVISLALGGTETAVSRQRYTLTAGKQYSFHANIHISPACVFIADLSTSGGAASRRISFYTNEKLVDGEYPIDVVFDVPADGDYALSMGIYSATASVGSLLISDLCINEGLIANRFELGNNNINNMFWKESVLGGGCTSNATNPFKFYLDNSGTVHFQGKIDCANAPTSDYNDLLAIPVYFTPSADCDFAVATSDGKLAAVHVNSGVGVVSIHANSDITAPYTVDLSGISYNIKRQTTLAIAPVKPI